MRESNLSTAPLLVYWLLWLAEKNDWTSYAPFAPAVVLFIIALGLYLYRRSQKAKARDDEWEYEKHSLLGAAGPKETSGRTTQPLDEAATQSSAEETRQPAQPSPATNLSPSRRGPLEDYIFQSQRKSAHARPPRAGQPTEPTTLEADSGSPPLAEETPPRRAWGRGLTRVGIGAVVVLAAALLLVAIYPSGEHSPAEETPLSAASEKRDTNRASDPLVGVINQALEYNLITSSGNPLFTPAERSELITKALQGLRDPSLRQQALHQHEAMQKKMQQEGFRKEAWYAHVAACKKVCSPAFATLVSTHFAKVGERTHTAVFFHLGQSSLDSTDRRDIQHIADLLSTSGYADKHLLLIGRASKIGNHELNMALSERRVQTVREALIKSGVSSDRIKSFWLGWEQPYLTTDIAERLQIPSELYGSDEMKLNQSVMLVIY